MSLEMGRPNLLMLTSAPDDNELRNGRPRRDSEQKWYALAGRVVAVKVRMHAIS